MRAEAGLSLDGSPGGALLGLQVRIHWSWFIIVGLLTWGLATAYYPPAMPAWSRAADWIAGLLTSGLFFASLLLHEMAHSLVARRLGLPVRRITLFVFGGVSELSDEPSSPGQEFWTTVAGPATSFAIAALFFLTWIAAAEIGVSWLRPVVGYLAAINLVVGLFNLLPGFPLDGGRILRSILWSKLSNLQEATRIASRVGRVVAALIAAAGVLLLLGGNVISGIWFLLIAWFLDSAASSSYRQLGVELALRDMAIAPLLKGEAPRLSPSASLRDFVDSVVLAQNQRAGFVGSDGLAGLISMSDLQRVPQEQWATTTVAQVMTPMERVASITDDTSAEAALAMMNTRRVDQLAVLMPNRAPQLLTRAALLEGMRSRIELASTARRSATGGA